MRRLPSAGVITSVMLFSAVALAPTPAAAATPVMSNPSSVPNTSHPASVAFNVGSSEALKIAIAGGATVTMTGPTEAPAAAHPFTGSNVTPDAIGGTLTASFDLDPPSALPAAPGTYDVDITPNGGDTPDDTSSVTVTNTQPTIGSPTDTAPVELAAGQTGVHMTVTASGGTFAAGDTLTLTHLDDAVAGLSFSSPDLQRTSFSGDISATRAVTPGSYDITITDTAGGTKVCSNCVKVDLGTGVAANLTASSITHTSATLTWSPPTTGPTDINGYAVFVSADPHPTSTDSDITVTHSATDTHATVSALHPGTEYYVAVVTTTIAGPGDPASLAFFTSEAGALSLNHTSLTLRFGQQATLSGHLTRGTGSSATLLPGRDVSLYVKTGTAPSVLLGTVQTDSGGNYSFTFKPKHNASYFANFAGSAATSTSPPVDPVRSKSAAGTVAQAITLKGAAVHHFRWLQLTGKVGPSAAGRTVVIYNKKDGHLRKYATAKLSATSTYKIVLKHVRSGRYKLIAKIAATRLNLAGMSKPLPVLKP